MRLFPAQPPQTAYKYLCAHARFILTQMPARGEREFDESSRKVGRSLGSAAMHADAKQTEFCTYLSGILLGGLSLNVPFGLWSVDRLFPQFNASQPSRPTVTGVTRSDFKTRHRSFVPLLCLTLHAGRF